MFENPITFGFLISIIITLIYFMINKKLNKDKKQVNNNEKYGLLFGFTFIIALFIRMNMNSNCEVKVSTENINTSGGNLNSNNILAQPPF